MRPLPVPDPGTPDTRSPRRFLLWLMARQRASVLLGIVWGCCWMIAQALVPAVIGSAVDALVSRNTTAFTIDCLAVLGLGIATALTGVLRHRRVVANFLDAAYRIIQLMAGQASALGNTLSRLLSTGEVISVGTADVDAIGMAIDVTGRGSGAVASLIVVAIILLSRSLPLGLIVLIGAPLMTALIGGLLRPLHRRQQRYRELQGQLASRAADIVAGLRVLRGIGGETAFSARYRDQSQELRHTGVHVARAESFLFGAEVLLPGLFVTAATWIAAHYALRHAITPGQLVTFYAYTSFLALPLATLTEAADKMVRGHVAAGRVIAILRLVPDVRDPASPAQEPPAGASLHDPVSGLTAHAGELIGLVSDDPAQAAALADRIGRYRATAADSEDGAGGLEQADPELGGVPLADLPVGVLRRRILVAENNAHLFAGRLAEELGGVRQVSDDEAIAAMSAAAAHDVLDSIPGGLHGQVTARGRSLSGGQAQRLRLARALLADAEVLVLVEPTSAVDAHTEARIARGLREKRQGRTTVVVTSSPLMLGMADKVAFLRNGQVASVGTHAELLTTSSEYAHVVSRGGEL
jgi:ABC-type multidrug transport system fused ATPase/permease subunit